MPQVACKICQKSFHAKRNWIRRGDGKYCSLACRYISQKKGKIVPCSICGKEVYKQRKALLHSKSKKYFCSKTCQAIWRNSLVYIGENHPNWKTGRHAYRSVMSRNNVVKICGLCNSSDARILAVHHIDRNRKNNTLKNLAWLCHNCHFLVHHDPGERDKFLRKRVV